jgi:hypothetical protein
MQIFEHLANDELLLISEENRNKILAIRAKKSHSPVDVRLKLDLEGEVALITAELRTRYVPQGMWIN